MNAMEPKDIKPIPNYIAKKIRKIDEKYYNGGSVRFYAYLTRINGELVKITVACKNYNKQWFCKQVAVHGIHSNQCLVRDMLYSYIAGYTVGWYDYGLSPSQKHYEDGNWYTADAKYFDPKAVIINKEFALKLDAYKYSAVDKYPYVDIFKYLRVYEQYPHAEYFVKLGLQHLATSKMLLRKTAKDKSLRRWLIQYAKILRNEYGTYPYFSVKMILDAYKESMPLLEKHALDLEKKLLLQDYTFKTTILRTIPKTETTKFLQYLKTQNTNCSSYADYLKACLYLDLDMSLPKNRYPHDFKHWHDVRIDQYHTAKAMKAEEERKALLEKFATVAEKYISLQRNKEDTFIVIIAKSPQELIQEGCALHHCVGRMNYDQRFAKEESLIFFVRNANAPDVPFVTMEYSIRNRQILQCYGENDHKPNDSVLEFVHKKWLPYANRKLKQIAA